LINCTVELYWKTRQYAIVENIVFNMRNLMTIGCEMKKSLSILWKSDNNNSKKKTSTRTRTRITSQQEQRW